MPDTRQLLYAGAAMALGAFALVETQLLTKDSMPTILDACGTASGNMTAFVESGYKPFVPWLGGAFLCMITQFIDDLVQAYPAGLIVWGVTVLSLFPAAVLVNVEAGRSGAKGPIRYPTAFYLLAIFIAVSVAFPLIWLPGYVLGRSVPHGRVALSRARFALWMLLPMTILTPLTFLLNPDTHAWTLVVGLYAGPLLALLPLAMWNMTPPEVCDAPTMEKTTKAIVRAYGISGALALIGWVWIVFCAWSYYGTDLSAVYADVWGHAIPSVAFMTIDAIVLYLGLILYLAYCRPSLAGEAMVLTPIFGPGAACALVMAQLEFERGEIKLKAD